MKAFFELFALPSVDFFLLLAYAVI